MLSNNETDEGCCRWGETAVLPAFPLAVCSCRPPSQPQRRGRSTSRIEQCDGKTLNSRRSLTSLGRWHSSPPMRIDTTLEPATAIRKYRLFEEYSPRMPRRKLSPSRNAIFSKPEKT